MASLAPYFPSKFFDGSAVAASYRLWTFESGTTTPKASYSSAAGTVLNTNPITLDVDGECSLWLGSGAYTLRLDAPLADGGGVIKTWDNITASVVSLPGGHVSSVEVLTLPAGETAVELDTATIVPGINAVMLFANGVYQTPGIDYTETAGARLDLAAPFAKDTDLVVVAGRLVTSGQAADAVSYTPAGTGAIPRALNVELDQGAVNPLRWITPAEWPAIIAGTTTNDYSDALEKAVALVRSNGYGYVQLPAGLMNTTRPWLWYQKVPIRGAGRGVTTIRKITNTVGSGSSRARSGTITDSYAVDSIVSVWHDDSAGATVYADQVSASGLTLEGIGNTYGIYAPRMSRAALVDVDYYNVITGFYTFDTWQTEHSNCTATACSYGWRYVNDGSGVGTGTSCTFSRCWTNFDNTIRQPVGTFEIFGLTYSALINTACDNLVRTTDSNTVYCYSFNTCLGIAMIGCGAESSKAGFLQASASQITLINPRTFSMSCDSAWATSAGIFNDGSALIFQGANFSAWSGAGANFYNQIVQGGATQIELQSAMPTGGNAFIGYGGGASRTIMANGQVRVINASGTANTVPLIGSATYDPPNLVDGAGTTTTVTVTGAALGDYATASFSLALQGITMTAWVSAADTVSVRFQNESGGALDLGSGTLRARVVPQ